MRVITNDTDKCALALAALEQVTDPEIGLNVVDLGLIYQIDFDAEAKKNYASMTLTTQFCPMGQSILGAVKNTLQQAFPGDEIEVGLTFTPRWSSEMISEKGKLFLSK